jgi:hypothetical protein
VKRLLDAGFQLRSNSVAHAVDVPMQATAAYAWADRMGSWKARWGVNRMNHTVAPGLYRLDNREKMRLCLSPPTTR